MMNNYHTHTYRCKHATGDINDYIKMAKLRNVEELGFSDHTPLPDGWWQDVRMGVEELEDYANAVRQGAKDNPQMRILLGLECDYSPEYIEFFKEIKEKYQMDYLIGSIHAFPYQGEMVNCFEHGKIFDMKEQMAYADAYVKAMESGIFTFMAHPDLFLLSGNGWSQEAAATSIYILEAAKDLAMPLEINTSGIRKSFERGKNGITYPNRYFWELASRFGISAIVNSDAHSPERLVDNLDAGHFLLKEYGLSEFTL